MNGNYFVFEHFMSGDSVMRFFVKNGVLSKNMHQGVVVSGNMLDQKSKLEKLRLFGFNTLCVG